MTLELIKELSPSVVTRAKPSAEGLLRARADINSDPNIQKVFRDGGNADYVVDAISVRLNAKWGGEEAEDAYQAALYLWDEYNQLGAGIHIVSRETGKVITTVTEDDIWQPPPVPRESGNMAIPLPRLRPDLEGAILSWTFEQGRERQIVSTLQEKAKALGLLDPCFRIATKFGRKQMVQEVVSISPVDLLASIGGTSAAFLRHFEMLSNDDEDTDAIAASVSAQTVLGVQDPTTSNLQFSHVSHLRGAIARGCVRHMAHTLARACHARSDAKKVREDCLTVSDLKNVSLWIGPPDVMRTFRSLTNVPFLPVEGAKVIGLTKPQAGTILIAQKLAGTSMERFDRWIAEAVLDYKLKVDWSALVAMDVEPNHQTEIVK